MLVDWRGLKAIKLLSRYIFQLLFSLNVEGTRLQFTVVQMVHCLTRIWYVTDNMRPRLHTNYM